MWVKGLLVVNIFSQTPKVVTLQLLNGDLSGSVMAELSG